MNPFNRRFGQSIPLRALLAGILAAFALANPCRAQNGSLFQDAPQAPTLQAPTQQGAPPAAAMAPNMPPDTNANNGVPYVGLPFGGGPAYVVGPGGIAGGNYFVPPNLQSSYTYQPPVPSRVLRVNDIVSIRVEEIAQMIAQGNTTSRKTLNFDAVLQDWVRMVGVDTIKPAPQSNGDPRARFSENEVYRGDSTMRLAEQMTFNIAARVADIQPNGNVVLEARKTIEQSDNRFEASLSGICRAEDIGPNNVVLSRHIYDLKINRQDSGHVRDGYSRGWLTKWYARIKPF
jgi:flagellar L-ring protein precursor FlgH